VCFLHTWRGWWFRKDFHCITVTNEHKPPWPFPWKTMRHICTAIRLWFSVGSWRPWYVNITLDMIQGDLTAPAAHLALMELVLSMNTVNCKACKSPIFADCRIIKSLCIWGLHTLGCYDFLNINISLIYSERN